MNKNKISKEEQTLRDEYINMANIPEETDEANETKNFKQKMNIENTFQIQNLNDDIVNIPVSISPATLINLMDVN